MADEVRIALSLDERQDIPFPRRELVLDRDNSSITVGRASKVETKGLVSLPSNAWIRSPVVSRNHAEIVADLDDKKVMIKDLGSLHGTFINDEKERLKKNELREIRDGDRLQLGVSIYRGADSFPPATMDVGIEYRQKRPEIPTSTTFQVPDSSDVEDSYSSDSSDSDVQEISGRKCQPRIITAPTAAVIDLTEVPPKTTFSHVIDLSSPPCSPLSVFDFPSDIGSPLQAPEESSTIASPDLSMTSHNPGTHSPHHNHSSDSENQSTDGEDEDEMKQVDQGFTDFDDEETMERHYQFDVHSSASDAESYDVDDMDDMEASDVDLMTNPSDASGLSDPDEYSDSERDEESEGYDEPEGYDEDAYDECSSEDEEDMGFPDEAFRSAVWENNPVNPLAMGPHPDFESKVTKSSNLATLLNDEKTSYPREASRAAPQAAYLPLAMLPPRAINPCRASFNTQTGEPKNTMDFLDTANRKALLFAERDRRLAEIEAGIQGIGKPRSSVHSLCNEGPFTMPIPDLLRTEFTQLSEPVKVTESAQPVDPVQLAEAVVTTTPRDPTKNSEPLADATPTSTATTRGSAQAPTVGISTEATNSSEQAPSDDAATSKAVDQSRERRHLRPMSISDIVEAAPPAAAPTTTSISSKRKADDISSSTVQEEQWASVGPDAEKEVVVISDLTQPSPAVKNSSGTSPPENLVSQEMNSRPAKRLRHIAERVGYAALGGVTAGAMIFGTLVYTAPTFA